MNPIDVLDEVILAVELAFAVMAGEWCLSRVGELVSLQILLSGEGLCALAALVRPFVVVTEDVAL